MRGLPREKDGIVVQAFKTARFYGDILSAVHVQGRAVVQAPVPATGDPEPLQKRRSGISPADTLVVSFCACACMWLCLCVDVRMRDRGIGISVMLVRAILCMYICSCVHRTNKFTRGWRNMHCNFETITGEGDPPHWSRLISLYAHECMKMTRDHRGRWRRVCAVGNQVQRARIPIEKKLIIGVQLFEHILDNQRCHGGVAANDVGMPSRAPIAAALPTAPGEAWHVGVFEGEVSCLEVESRHLEHIGEPRRVHPRVHHSALGRAPTLHTPVHFGGGIEGNAKRYPEPALATVCECMRVNSCEYVRAHICVDVCLCLV